MRIPSGTVDQYIYFTAVDATDFTTRETGLTTFTVYRSRNGGAAAAMTTPTVNEVDATNMPGVYELLLDEDMTIDAGDDSQEMCFHITHAGMAPVTRTIELYRPKITAGETLTVTSGEATVTVTEDSKITTGTAQAATASTIQLASAETFADDEVIGSVVVITGGSTGVGQSRIITDYVSSTDTATVSPNWTTTPTGTITYAVYAAPPSPTASGSLPNVNVAEISGDSTAADNLESYCDGTTPQPVNVTHVSGSAEDIATATALATVDANIDAVLVDTATTLDGKLDTIDAIVDELRLGVITGAAQTGTLSTTQATTDLTGYADDQLIGRVIVWTSGACEGEATDITDYASASGLLTFTALTTAPANTDTFKIV